MYKILIKHNPNANKSDTTIWRMHGSTTTTTFTEFATDDIDTLKVEILSLDSVYGHDNIRVIKEIDINYTVDVADSDVITDNPNEAPSEPTDPNPDEASGDSVDSESIGS